MQGRFTKSIQAEIINSLESFNSGPTQWAGVNFLDLDLYYFSYTGISETLAKDLAKRLKLTPKALKTYSLPYPLWLFLSFIPSLKIKTFFERPSFKRGIFIFPKWTFNCPPATTFLTEVSFEKLLLIITYGGFKEKSYGKYYQKLGFKNSKEVTVLYVRRKDFLQNKEKILENLVSEIFKIFKDP